MLPVDIVQIQPEEVHVLRSEADGLLLILDDPHPVDHLAAHWVLCISNVKGQTLALSSINYKYFDEPTSITNPKSWKTS